MGFGAGASKGKAQYGGKGKGKGGKGKGFGVSSSPRGSTGGWTSVASGKGQGVSWTGGNRSTWATKVDWSRWFSKWSLRPFPGGQAPGNRSDRDHASWAPEAPKWCFP